MLVRNYFDLIYFGKETVNSLCFRVFNTIISQLQTMAPRTVVMKSRLQFIVYLGWLL